MDRLTQIQKQIEDQKQPPVDKWNPKQLGEIDILIDSQGFWFHEGDPIQREELVQLFSSILWHESDQYYLVTPVEKLAIRVEDVPYTILQMDHVEDYWVGVTNTHEQVVIGHDHPVMLRTYSEQLIPYIRIRYDLWGRVSRSIYYQWVSTALGNQSASDGLITLTSGDYQFEVARED
jgi:hypothetical protein